MQAVVRFVIVVVLSAASPAVTVAQDFLALVEWGRTECDMTIPFDLQQRTTGARDIVTQEPLKAHDTVFMIPDKCLITTAKAINHPSTYGLFNPQMASQSPERQKFYEKRQSYDSILLPLYLLHLMDEGDDGFFAPYVRILPNDVNNFVCLWDDDDKSLLPFNTLVDLFIMCAQIRAMYDDICAVVPAFGEQRNFVDWQRAFLLANSRDLALTVDGEKHTALAPVYDLFNHAMQANIRWNYYNDRGGVGGEVMHMNISDGKFYVDEDFVVPAGTEMQISYKESSQSILLLYYGFTLSCGWETRWRSLLPNHTPFSSDSEAASRCRDKLKLRTENAAYELTTSRDGTDDIAFLESVRHTILDTSGDVEVPMWRAVHRLVSDVEFPLDVSEAGPLLEAATPGSCEYNALNVLIGQWSVAMAWISHTTEMISNKENDQTQSEGTTTIADGAPLEAGHGETQETCVMEE